ncbi:MAG: hypothetical protein ACP5QT_03665 [Brevinematia bacterium]
MSDFLRFFRKPTSLQFSFLGLVIFIFVMTFSINAGKSAIEGKGQLKKVKNFNLVAKWTGTNGEVVEDFILVNDLLYSAVGEKGIYVFKRENLEFVTNLILETNEMKFNIKRIDVLKAGGSNFFVASFLNGVGENERGLILFSIGISNVVSELNVLPLNFSTPKSFCVVDNKIYVLTSAKEIFEFEFDNLMGRKIKRYMVNINGGNIIRHYKNLFYIPANEDGLYIAKLERGEFRIVSRIVSEINYVSDCSVSGEKIAVSDRMLGVTIYKISDISRPKLFFHYDTSGDAFSVSMSKNDVFVADGINGVLGLEYKDREYRLAKIYKQGAIADQIFFDEKRKLLYSSFGVNGISILK